MIILTGSVRNFSIIYGISEKPGYNIRSDITVKNSAVENFIAIIRQYYKNTNTAYVYESESYWDKEKNHPGLKRRLIGKVDPVTGEIVIAGKRRKRPKADKDHTSESSLAHSQPPFKTA